MLRKRIWTPSCWQCKGLARKSRKTGFHFPSFGSGLASRNDGRVKKNKSFTMKHLERYTSVSACRSKRIISCGGNPGGPKRTILHGNGGNSTGANVIALE